MFGVPSDEPCAKFTQHGRNQTPRQSAVLGLFAAIERNRSRGLKNRDLFFRSLFLIASNTTLSPWGQIFACPSGRDYVKRSAYRLLCNGQTPFARSAWFRTRRSVLEQRLFSPPFDGPN